MLIRAAGVPESLRKKWSGKVEFVEAGHRIDVREAVVVYTIAPVLSTGRFAMVTVNAAEQLARPADSVPAHYASGTTYYLMRVGEEWVIVAASAWVT